MGFRNQPTKKMGGAPGTSSQPHLSPSKKRRQQEMEHLMCFVPGWLALGAQYNDQRRDDRHGFLSLKNWKLWNIYGKTMAKSMEKMEKSIEEMGNLRNIWNIYGKRGTETMEPPQIAWFMITCPMNNCHFIVIPCYTVVPHSQMQPYFISFLQSKYWGDITMILWVMFPRT